MNTPTLGPMPARPLAERAADAWTEAVIHTYFKAYREVLSQLEAEKGTSLLVTIINKLLDRMHRKKIGAHEASISLMDELESKRSRLFVMAAAVEVLIHKLAPGTTVTSVHTLKETMEKAE